MSHLRSNGINLYYEEHGSGEPLVLIMGFTVSSIGWHWNIPSFAQHFRTIAFDNRGVGQSDKPDYPYSMAMFADDTAGILDHLKIEQAHVFGISMGGMIAQEFALRHPQRVKTLILGCTNCGGPTAVPSKDPDVLNLLGNIESVDVQQAALIMTKVAVTPWFMQKHMDILIQLN
jgi:pimeloyl-ACP methyl ester carboxylesterase